MATKYTLYFSDTTKTEISIYPYTANGPVSPSDNTLISQAVAQDTTLKLYGKGMQDYGEGIEQNLVYILENFANSTAPVNAKEGQLWYDNIGTGSPQLPELSVYNGISWDSIILANGATAMTGFLTLNADPTQPLHAATMQYVDAVVVGSGLTLDQNTFLDGLDLPTLTAAEVNALKGINVGSPTVTVQDQLDGKLNRSTNDGMDLGVSFTLNAGDLNLSSDSDINIVNGSIIMNTIAGSPLGNVSGLPAVPAAADHAASKAYVDSQVLTAGGDGVLTSTNWATATGGSPTYVPNPIETTLQLTVTYPDTSTDTITAEGISRAGHIHAASVITFDDSGLPPLGISGATVQAVIEDIEAVKAPKSSPAFVGNVTMTSTLNVTGETTLTDVIADSLAATNGGSFGGVVSAADPINDEHLATKSYVDSAIGVAPTGTLATRTLESLAADITTPTPWPVQSHISASNKLSITINGIKQYEDTHAEQKIQYDSNTGTVTGTTYTGLDQTRAHEFDINIDGAGATTVTIPVGTNTTTHADLVTAINNIMSTGSPQLVISLFQLETPTTEKFISYTSGAGSTIAISDPATGGSPSPQYLFATDAAPTAIANATFLSNPPILGGSPPMIPDDIIIAGDVTTLFPAGKTFTIRGSTDVTYGSFDGVYRVHSNGPVYPTGSPGTTSIPIAWIGNADRNVPLLESYQIVGSPLPAAPAPSSYGNVHFTPIGGFDQILTATAGVVGDYEETNSAGVSTPPGVLTDYVVFNITIPSGNKIETILLV